MKRPTRDSAAPSASGALYVVATPLGNPGDLAPRAAAVLGSADVILAEDTRTVRRLLAEHGIALGTRPLLSCYDANEAARAAQAVDALAAGRSVALVSEAGTPGISDPGFRVVRAAIAAGASVVPVPGPSAVTAALTASGLPADRFLFLGFPPRRAGARARLFGAVRDLPFTIVLYESPLRAAGTLSDLADALGDRPACLARELTKTHEELVRGRLRELEARYRQQRPLGEVTLVVAGVDARPHLAKNGRDDGQADDEDLGRRAARLLDDGKSTRDAAADLAAATGRPRRALYRLVNAVRERRGG